MWQKSTNFWGFVAPECLIIWHGWWSGLFSSSLTDWCNPCIYLNCLITTFYRKRYIPLFVDVCWREATGTERFKLVESTSCQYSWTVKEIIAWRTYSICWSTPWWNIWFCWPALWCKCLFVLVFKYKRKMFNSSQREIEFSLSPIFLGSSWGLELDVNLELGLESWIRVRVRASTYGLE